MCRTPAPPSTAFVASSIWSGVGEVKTSPGQAASSIPRPTKPPCIGSCPEPPPETRPTFPTTGASRLTTREGATDTPTRSAWASGMPSSSSRTTSSGALISFFIWPLLRLGAGSLRPDEVEDDRAQDAADDGCHHRHPGVAPVRVALAGDGQEGVGDAGPEVTGRVDGV